MKSKSFGTKCKCGHLESEHIPQKGDSPKSVMRFQMRPKGHLPMGMARQYLMIPDVIIAEFVTVKDLNPSKDGDYSR